ncbi:MAG: tetratricopeptide repeat protein [Bacteroidales bacterium]|nr:tetratricopeptide repeat protein [Bacteroidales bacterium]
MIQKLKDSIESKFGNKIAYQKDCKALSNRIFNDTSQVISPSTLRRFFGFLSTNSNPSNATLDILSIYCGYSDWEEYKSKNSSNKYTKEPIFSLWEKANDAAKNASHKSCRAIKNNQPFGFENTIPRQFANERFESFINSNYVATPIIGPGKFGKTTLLVNWYDDYTSKPTNRNNIVLFMPALRLEYWVNTGSYIDQWLLSELEVPSSELFDTLNANEKLAPGKLIVIIDALDDVSGKGIKTNKIYTAIQQLAANFSGNWFKLIVSSRTPAWTEFAKQCSPAQTWLYASHKNLSSNQANIPPLREFEIQGILDNTINKDTASSVIIEEIASDVLQIVSHPYYLQLLIDSYSQSNLHLIINKIDLVVKFLKLQVYQSQHNEEKIDILKAIISLSHQNKTYDLIKKNDLKKMYPIHLKQSGNYSTAYNQLLSFGVITEEIMPNEFGTYSVHVKISQRILYRVLLLLTLVEDNNGIDFSLFKLIESKYKGSAMKPHLVNLLFELAYNKKLSETLKHFFSLSDSTLEKVFTYPYIHNTLSREELMRKELIPYYAGNSKARKFLFEKTVNLNTIANSSRLLYLNYLQNSTSEKDVFMGKTLLYASNAYCFDFNWVNQFSDDFPFSCPNFSSSPIISGLWFSCRFFVLHIKKELPSSSIYDDIEKYVNSIGNNWSSVDRHNFEIALFFGMVNTKQYRHIRDRLSYITRKKDLATLSPQEKTLSICYQLANWQLTREIRNINIPTTKQLISDAPPWASYQTSIIEKTWLAICYLNQGNTSKAYEHYKRAIKISSIYGYTLFEVRLLLSLAKVLESVGEHEKAEECVSLSHSLGNNSNIDFDLL